MKRNNKISREFSEAEIPSEWIKPLSDHFPSVHAFQAVCQIHDSHSSVCRLLDTTAAELDAVLAKLSKRVDGRNIDLTPTPVCTGMFGCEMHDTEQDKGVRDPITRSLAMVSRHSGLPRKVTHVDKMEAIRDQGRRGTCVAQAFTAVSEFWEKTSIDLHSCLKLKLVLLSESYKSVASKKYKGLLIAYTCLIITKVNERYIPFNNSLVLYRKRHS